MTAATFTTTPLAQVQNTIAEAMLHLHPQAARHNHIAVSEKRIRTVGNITLRKHQAEAETLLLNALRELSGAILADDTGLGKTWVALSIAQHYERLVVIAPAILVPMWKGAIAQAAIPNTTVLSLHSFSTATPSLPDAGKQLRTLVIIDEAHHLRNRNTQRHRHISDFVTGHHLLLLSATPVHNSEADMKTLLSLFMGSRSDSLDDAILQKVVVRRTRQMVELDQIPEIVRHPPVAMPADRSILNAILTLPDPLPARTGTAAGALIRLGLLGAWCSSDAALSHSLRLRRLRGEAMAHAISMGRYPSQDELKAWIVADDSVQLAFPEIVVAETADHTLLQPILKKHLDALAELQLLHADTVHYDDKRADILRKQLDQNPDRPVLAFSRYTATVHAIYRALSDIAGVAAIAGGKGRIASGQLPRQEILWRFAPAAHNRKPPPAHERVRLLISTDIIAEGVNLQDAGTVVHLDMPWTDAARLQREGRAVRLGSPFPYVHVLTIAPPAPVELVTSTMERLERKAGTAQKIAHNPPEAAAALKLLLSHWRTPQHPRSRTATLEHSQLVPATVAVASGACSGWIAAITDNTTRLIASLDGTTTESAQLLLTIMTDLRPVGRNRPTHDALVRKAFDELGSHIGRIDARIALGPAEPELGPPQLRILTLLNSTVQNRRVTERKPLMEMLQEARLIVEAAHSSGGERALQEWIAQHRATNAEDFLSWWKNSATLRQLHKTAGYNGEPLPRHQMHVAGMIVVLPRSTADSFRHATRNTLRPRRYSY